MSDMDSMIEVGFYGKLPTYGDFIQKRLPTDFINPWHEWLQSGMMACRERDQEGWMSYYLNCPAWNFVLASGICGQQPVAGVTIPSVDRVGRYFNFTMASILPSEVNPPVFASTQSQWLEGLENLALSVLEEDLDQDGIERLINESAAELNWNPDSRSVFSSGEDYARVIPDNASSTSEMLSGMLHQMISREHERYGLWWHHGSSQVGAQLLSCANMPSGEIYLGLMMDEDSIPTTEAVVSTQPPEVDYMDELLSD